PADAGLRARWRRVSIRRRFVVVISVALAVAVAVLTVCAYLVTRSSLEDQLDQSLRQEYNQIARGVRAGSSYVQNGPCLYAGAPACARVVTAAGKTVVVGGLASKIPR